MTPAQYMFSVAAFVQASALLTAFFTSVSKQDSWFAVIMGCIICLPFLWVYVSLMKHFPGKSLVQINECVFGPALGKIISCLYLWFFLTLTSLNLRDLGDFVKNTIMPKTPTVVVVVLFIAVCAWSVRHGIEAVSRYSIAFSILSILVALTATIFTVNSMNLRNFLPSMQLSVREYAVSSHIVSTIPFGETVAFLMITPNIKLPAKKYGKYFLLGYLIGGLMLLSIVLRDTAVLGKVIWFFSSPSFETFRLVKFVETLNRMEILFALILIIMLFAKITFLLYVSVLAIAQIFNLNSFRTLVLPTAAVVGIYCFILYSSSLEHAASAAEITPILWTPFEFILPLITLILVKIRKIPAETGEIAA